MTNTLLYGTNLTIKHLDKDGQIVKVIDHGPGTITNAGVIYIAESFTGATRSLSAFNYHDSGIGTTAASVGDTALENKPAGVPVRVLGVQTCPLTAQYKSVATQTYTQALSITEWGLFSALINGTMLDRKIFSAYNVTAGEGLQFEFTLSISSGG